MLLRVTHSISQANCERQLDLRLRQGSGPIPPVRAPTITSTSFHDSVYPHPIASTLIMPKILAEQVGAALAAKGHHVVSTPLQKPYGQQPSGAGAVKMIRIDPRSGVFAAGVSPAKDDYAIGW